MTLGILLSIETGLLTPTAVSLVLLLVVDRLDRLDADDSVTEIYHTRKTGITDTEAIDYLTMTNEIRRMKQEEREDARKEIRRQRRRRNG